MPVNKPALLLVSIVATACLASCDDRQPAVEDNRELTATKEGPVDGEFEAKARVFLAALFSREETALAPYELFPGALIEAGKLRQRNRTFIEVHLRPLASKQEVVPILNGRSGSQFTVLFVKRDAASNVRDPKFLQSEYLDEYFACSFDDAEGRWRIRDGFCFDETDGPYPIDNPEL